MSKMNKSCKLVLLLLSAGSVVSCKTLPSQVVTGKCPALPDLPRSLAQPPKSQHALTELQSALAELAEVVKPTPLNSPSSKPSTTPSDSSNQLLSEIF